MSLHVHWFLPTSGDSREVVGMLADGTRSGGGTGRDPDIDYLAQVARAAEQAGFEAVLTPAGLVCEDAWLITAALTRETTRLKFLVAFRPGFLSPTLAAQMAATYQRLSGGRLLLNIVTGSDPDEQRRYGDFLDHDQRYARTEEFLHVVRGAWSGEPLDFDGRHYQVRGATVLRPPDPLPTVFFGGASPAGQRVAARQADVYLSWGEPPPAVAERVAGVRALAAEQGRELRFGIRLHVIARDTSAEAWAEADRLLAAMDPAAIAAAQARFAGGESEGQRRMAALHGGDRGRLEVYPGLWAGYGLVRPGAGTALVGSHAEVADLIAEYAAAGMEHVILSGQPHLEEAYRVGEGVLPELRRRGLLGPARAGVPRLLRAAAS